MKKSKIEPIAYGYWNNRMYMNEERSGKSGLQVVVDKLNEVIEAINELKEQKER